jgi:mono/diheme cytochrome c family protein
LRSKAPEAAAARSASGAQTGSADVGPNPRHISITYDGQTIYVSRFVTPPLPGEETGLVHPDGRGGEVLAVNAANMNVRRTIVLQHSDKTRRRGSGQRRAELSRRRRHLARWHAGLGAIEAGQHRARRAAQRDSVSTSRAPCAPSARASIWPAEVEDYAARVDHDNAGVANAATYDRYGVYLFIALETSREVAVVDAFGHFELFRFQVGRAPQGLAISPDGLKLYVNNFMDRTVGVYDLGHLMNSGVLYVPELAVLSSITTEKLTPEVLAGKQLFYDARDLRLARDRYISCAACHNDGGGDGRTWDLTGFGEGLRNTIPLRGRAGAQGFLHWSNNFDEVHDFEGQIRNLSGGLGLMPDAYFYAGTRSEPLGDPKAGLSADLDALAAYVASLNKFASSPLRNPDGTLTSDAVAGKTVFTDASCGSCHSGQAFTDSGANTLRDVGTLKPSSGMRLYGPLTGIDTPTLRDVWSSAPYLHDGSAATLADAVQAHDNVSLTSQQLAQVAAYVGEIGGQESSAPLPLGTGNGVTGAYYNNTTFSGAPVLQRTERINFNLERLAGRSGPRRSVLGALAGQDRGAGERQLCVPERLRRGHPRVGERPAHHR